MIWWHLCCVWIGLLQVLQFGHVRSCELLCCLPGWMIVRIQSWNDDNDSGHEEDDLWWSEVMEFVWRSGQAAYMKRSRDSDKNNQKHMSRVKIHKNEALRHLWDCKSDSKAVTHMTCTAESMTLTAAQWSILEKRQERSETCNLKGWWRRRLSSNARIVWWHFFGLIGNLYPHSSPNNFHTAWRLSSTTHPNWWHACMYTFS